MQLRSTRFDPALLQPGDFALAGIQPPANILRAVAKRQAEFRRALCARAALFALDGRAQTPAVGEDRAPVWPAAISGSITHGDRWAAALAARGDRRGLGLTWKPCSKPSGRATCMARSSPKASACASPTTWSDAPACW